MAPENTDSVLVESGHFKATTDQITRLMETANLVPAALQGNDRFLDIITWNVRYFDNTVPERITIITKILEELNGDVFVLQEVEDGALDAVVKALNDKRAGSYRVVYGTTGGDQRIAIMYDRDWVKASHDPVELFADDNPVVAGQRSRIFNRLPLHLPLTAYREDKPFSFDLVGVHLKSQLGGGEIQRREAAKRLAHWMTKDAEDDDVIFTGDWNAVPTAPEYRALQQLDKDGDACFQSWNAAAEGSHFYKGKKYRYDMIVVTDDSAGAAPKKGAEVVTWSTLLASGGTASTKQALKDVISVISDHLPVLARFYFTDNENYRPPKDKAKKKSAAKPKKKAKR